MQFCLFIKRIPSAGPQATSERVASRWAGPGRGLRLHGAGALLPAEAPWLVQRLHMVLSRPSPSSAYSRVGESPLSSQAVALAGMLEECLGGHWSLEFEEQVGSGVCGKKEWLSKGPEVRPWGLTWEWPLLLHLRA